jgi:K+-transporting ATPase ATPase C chain
MTPTAQSATGSLDREATNAAPRVDQKAHAGLASLVRPALLLLLVFTLLTGLAYPLLVTGIAQVLFPSQANGSLIRENGKVVGSELIGQAFASPRYFWSRPSATAPYAYNAGASTGTNQGPLNPALKDAVAARVKALKEADPGNTASIPVDLVTSSGSGLDPHISPAAAYYQVSRVARERGLSVDAVHQAVDRQIEGRTFGLLGEPRVNVLLLNRALDRLSPTSNAR